MAEELRNTVGERIRAVRRERGMSAQDLADTLGWPLDTLVNYEYGRRPLQLNRLEAIASALALPAAALLVSDTATATIIARLLAEPSLAHDVGFFIDALDSEGSPQGSPDSAGDTSSSAA
jgi:transcriptional regulator with XRE-family HTH domain